MKLLITGGTGFIGKNLVEQYSARHDVFAPSRADLDLLDAAAVREYLEFHRFDTVIHTATERSTRRSGGGPELCSRNCRMFFNFARSSHAFGRMLFLSSGAVYSRAHWHPQMAESDFDTYVPEDDYGFSKYVCAKATDTLENIYELRLFGVFGPYEDWQVRFISNACCRAVCNLPVLVRQNVFFDYLDVADLGQILERFGTQALQHRHYNVCTGRAVELHSLAAMVVSISGKQLDLEIRNPGLGREYSGDNRRMLAEMPGLQFRDLSESVERLYRWYEESAHTIDPGLLRFDG